MPSRDALLITCEHGGNRIPSAWGRHFRARRHLLKSHRGWDPGALELAEHFAEQFGVPFFASTTSRLLIELNRSQGHPRLFSVATRDLPQTERNRLLEEFYRPYRGLVEAWIAAALGLGRKGSEPTSAAEGVIRRAGIEPDGTARRVVHVSVHSFTPVLDGEVRNADIGLLYDPARPGERGFCERWKEEILARDATLRVRRNYPYLGKSDGFVTHLRRLFPKTRYVGIELEVNQHFPLARAPRRRWSELKHVLADGLRAALDAG